MQAVPIGILVRWIQTKGCLVEVAESVLVRIAQGIAGEPGIEPMRGLEVVAHAVPIAVHVHGKDRFDADRQAIAVDGPQLQQMLAR